MISRERLHNAKKKAFRRVSRSLFTWMDNPYAYRFIGKSTSTDDVYHHNLVRHRKVTSKCSCACCGNPRRYLKGKEKVTIQERREAEDGGDSPA